MPTNNKATLQIVVIVGPTASGKSALAIKLAQKYNGEIISADSRQVYRGMDIGTGKVTKKEQWVVKHHLIDLADPKKQFTADDFKKLGENAIQDIISRGKTPIIVGGTGFYIDILLGRMAMAPVAPDKKLRAQFDKLTTGKLFEKLKILDPKRAEVIDKHNRRRLIRALEIVMITKKSSLNTSYEIQDTRYKILWLGLKPKDLEKIIKTRLDSRLKQGMIKEVTKLHKQGVSWKRLDSFGLEYRWISRWLIKKLRITDYGLKRSGANSQFVIRNSEFTNSEEYQNLLRDIVRYSKRQMTWFKRNKEIHWFTPNGVEGLKRPKSAKRLVISFLGR